MPIVPVQPIDLVATQMAAQTQAAKAAEAAQPVSFAQMLTQGIDATNLKVTQADQLVAQAAVDTSIPIHRVTYALEEARISLELMIQVRNRLIDASQQLMNMQI